MRERRWRLVRARRDAVPASVRLFTARARRHRLRAAAPWLITAVVLLVLGGLATVGFATPLLGVARVRVTGTQFASVEQVRAAAAVPRGTPLARVDTDAVARRIGALPPVRRVDVRRDWPDALVITVTERTPAAVVARADGFLLVDASGVPYASVPSRPDDLPLVELADPDPADRSTRAALTVLAALPPALRERLLLLRADAPARIRLELFGGRTVVWGDATANAAKARVVLALLERPGTVIDVSAPDVVTVR